MYLTQRGLLMKQNQTFLSSDGLTTIHAVIWEPEGEPKAVIQLIHGMVEYIERYDDFANYLTSQGFVVVGHDHLGHGQSVRSIEDWGYICDIAPARALIRDIHKLRKLTSKANIVDIETAEFADEYSLSDNLDSKMLSLDIENAVNELGEPDKEIVIRYYYYYQSTPKIADILGINADTVKTKLRRARLKLRKFLTERGY